MTLPTVFVVWRYIAVLLVRRPLSVVAGLGTPLYGVSLYMLSPHAWFNGIAACVGELKNETSGRLLHRCVQGELMCLSCIGVGTYVPLQ